MPETVIRAEGLTRDFGDIRALDALSIDVPAGIIFGFLGPNGSGKTTTIRILLGLLEPTAGRAEVLGFDTRSQSHEIRARCGSLLEQPGLYERFSAEANLELYGRIWGMSAGDRRARIKELLDRVGLWDRRKETAADWSRGMKQKLAVARALLHRPRVIFLDEPTAGLDPVAAAALRDDLASLAEREGVTVFLTTHNLTEAEKLCGRVAVIRAGKLLAAGHPDVLRSRTGGERAEIAGSGFTEPVVAMLRARPDVAAVETRNGRLHLELRAGADVAPIVASLVSAGAGIEEVRKGKASLEEVFLTLVEEEQ